ncbi:mechanosensitive ion channel protein MscS [Arachidicoccus ginsenosidimutans]|uniref:mechanosensitive ion channel family protein n=1 Tax=Arachidicoccus sp. BS20 TaxID=1850526 RepID=UPI0007F17325|nr:mechanosensitive ion channel domain-containing protein [Arachidicoccus sp. BS20]ANI88245.1 mechanosensitive ion channel protein MscS [Arachidicoccus sp. BS20]
MNTTLPPFDNHFVYKLLIKEGVSSVIASWLNTLILFVLLLIAGFIFYKILYKLLSTTLGKLATRTSGQFDDYLIQYNVLKYFTQLPLLIIIIWLIPWILSDFSGYISFFLVSADIYMILLAIWLIRSFLFAGRDYLKTREAFKDKPVESFVQVGMIVLYFIGALLIFSRITGRSILAFLTAMGAASAVLLLIFKDTLLGFVASIQVSANDMVRIGDWITLDKYGADGDVIEINLTTVKIQNFDKTITTIPTYYLISDSFRNWRGMQQEGGRRIKRAINIKLSSIRYLTSEDIKRMKQIQLLERYIEKMELQIHQYNNASSIDKSLLINGRNLTNVGVFRKYIEVYLEQHPSIHKELTMMVRQLPPSEKGMPIELYAFTNDVEWINYEHIMADIFDHLLAAVNYFDLEIFEFPSSAANTFITDIVM